MEITSITPTNAKDGDQQVLHETLHVALGSERVSEKPADTEFLKAPDPPENHEHDRHP